MDKRDWTVDEDAGRITLEDVELADGADLLAKEDLTWGRVRDIFASLGVDPDAILQGRDIELPEVPDVGAAQELFDLLVLNSDDFVPVAKMQFYRAKSLLAVLIAHFIEASRASSATPSSA